MQHIFFLNFGLFFRNSKKKNPKYSCHSISYFKVRFRLVDYYDLAKHGVRSRGRNFYLREKDLNAVNEVTANDDAEPTIGVWHVLPASLSDKFEKITDDGAIERSLDEQSHGVFIYLHGNSFDRTTEHRTELYNVLSQMDFHVLAIDYRGHSYQILYSKMSFIGIKRLW